MKLYQNLTYYHPHERYWRSKEKWIDILYADTILWAVHVRCGIAEERNLLLTEAKETRFCLVSPSGTAYVGAGSKNKKNKMLFYFVTASSLLSPARVIVYLAGRFMARVLYGGLNGPSACILSRTRRPSPNKGTRRLLSSHFSLARSFILTIFFFHSWSSPLKYFGLLSMNFA